MNPLIALGAALVGAIVAKTASSDESARAGPSPQASRGGGSPTSYVVTPVTPAGSTGAAETASGHYSVVEGVRRLVV